MKKKTKSLRKWTKNIPKEILDRMIPEKLQVSYKRPSFKDMLAEQIFVVSKRSTCLFNNVAAIIFRGDQILSIGYNGPSKGDVHCYEIGCSRIANGKLMEGAGMCRGSHAELNSICNAAKNGVSIDGASMMISFSPCKTCAKQIVNQGIKEVYYILEYNVDKDVKKYLRRLGVKVIRYRTKDIEKWTKK
jgi:dCMP deaminase